MNPWQETLIYSHKYFSDCTLNVLKIQRQYLVTLFALKWCGLDTPSEIISPYIPYIMRLDISTDLGCRLMHLAANHCHIGDLKASEHTTK